MANTIAQLRKLAGYQKRKIAKSTTKSKKK